MPALPWIQRQTVEPEREYVAMASRLPLRRHRFIPGFLRDTLRIRRQLSSTDGLVGYALNAELGSKTFWTFSVWTDRPSLEAFATAEPHAGIMGRLRGRMGDTRFEFFAVAGSEVPIAWKEIAARLGARV
jgi:hypothetical protein